MSSSARSVQHQHFVDLWTLTALALVLKALAPGQEKTKTHLHYLVIEPIYPKSTDAHFQLVCLLPGNKTTEDSLIKMSAAMLF